MPDAPIVEIVGLTKCYGRVPALSGLDLQVTPGEIYGFLGRNGAGKSTTLRILMGLTQADGGTVHLFGEQVRRSSAQLRARIGYVAQEQHFYDWMTPFSLGRFVRAFYPTWSDGEYERLLKLFDLPNDRKTAALSGGMKVKLALALALAHRPPLLVLDEPTAGLDPVARREFLELVIDASQHGGQTILFSTHYLEDVQRVARRVGIVEDGRMRYEGNLLELGNTIKLLKRPIPAADTEAADQPLPPPGPDFPVTVLNDRVRDGERQIILQCASDFAVVAARLPGWTIVSLPLEDVFIELVRRAPPKDA